MTATTRQNVIRRGFLAYLGPKEHATLQSNPESFMRGEVSPWWQARLGERADSDGIQDRFTELLAWWREETAHLSSVNAICTHEAYQQIIGLGPPALPLILRELEQRPGLWSWALRAITGQRPSGVSPGDVQAMAEFWTQWGRANGHL